MGTRRSCLFKWPNPRWPLWLPHAVTRERPPPDPSIWGPSWVGFRFSDVHRLSVPCTGAWAHDEGHGWVQACVYVHTHPIFIQTPLTSQPPRRWSERLQKGGLTIRGADLSGDLVLQAPFHPLRHGLHLASFPPWRHPGATLKPTEEWPPIPAGLRRFAGPRRWGEGLWDLPCLRLWASVGSVAPGLPARQGLGRMNE